MKKGVRPTIVDGKKECRVCKQWKPIEEFSLLKTGTLFYRCKECQRVHNHSEKGIRAKQKYYKSEKHKDAHKREITSGKSAERQRARRRSDATYKLATDFRTYMNQKVNFGRNHHSWEYLGCSWKFFKEYIESQFKPGMTWKNRGIGKDKWHLDHIIPCAYFDFSIERNLYIAWNWRNFQPLWGGENLQKANKLPDNYRELLIEIESNLEKGVIKRRIFKKKIT